MGNIKLSGLVVGMFALVVGLNAGCNKAKSGTAGLVSTAESVADLWAAKDWAAIRAHFDPTMTAAMTEDKLAESYAKVVKMVGSFTSRGKGEGRKQAGYFVVRVPLTFAESPMKMRVVFNKKKQIAGFFVLALGAP